MSFPKNYKYSTWSAINSSGHLVFDRPYPGVINCHWQMELCAHTKRRHQQIWFETVIPMTVWEVRAILMQFWCKPRLLPWKGPNYYTMKKASQGPENTDNHYKMWEEFKTFPLEKPVHWTNDNLEHAKMVCEWVELYRAVGHEDCDKYGDFWKAKYPDLLEPLKLTLNQPLGEPTVGGFNICPKEDPNPTEDCNPNPRENEVEARVTESEARITKLNCLLEAIIAGHKTGNHKDKKHKE